MNVSVTLVVERIARVLAGQRLSVNGEGGLPSAALDVDLEWADHVDTALAVLRTLREPDATMVRVGDLAIWQRMIEAALQEAPVP